MENISWSDFEKIKLRIGTVVTVEDFPKARNPSYILHVDFGKEIGIKKASSQLTVHYQKEQLLNKQVVAVVNFPPKQIGPIMSECLVTGFYDENGDVILAVPDKTINNGAIFG